MESGVIKPLEQPIPRLIYGTASLGSLLPGPFGNKEKQDRQMALLDQVLDLGCTAFDTAAIYQLGGTERLLGEWMRTRRNRDRVVLISKGGAPGLLGGARLSERILAGDLHGSLRRLGTDRIDLYLLHRDDPSAPVGPMVDALARFHREGKIRAYGVSNWEHTRVAQAQEHAASRGFQPLSASSPHLSLADWVRVPWPGCVSVAGGPGGPAREYHQRTQLPLLAWSPLGGGYFSGSGDAEPTAGLKAYDSDPNRARRKRAAELAAKKGVTLQQVALAYVLCQPFPSFAVVAASTREKMQRNIEAAQVRLTGDELSWLETGSGASPGERP